MWTSGLICASLSDIAMGNSESDRATNYNSSTLCGLIRSSLACQSEPCFVSIRPVSFHSDLSQFSLSYQLAHLVRPSSPRQLFPWFVPVHPRHVPFQPGSSQFTPSAFVLVRLNSSRQLSPWFVPIHPVSLGYYIPIYPYTYRYTVPVRPVSFRPNSPCQLGILYTYIPIYLSLHCPSSPRQLSPQFTLSACALIGPTT